MKRALLLCSVCFLMLGSSYAQTQTEGKTTITNPVLKEQVEKIQTKESQIAVSSRAQANQLNEELVALKAEYVRLLSAELEKTTDTQLRTQLQEEIKRYSEVTNSQTR